MKPSNQHILETLIINKDYIEFKITPKSFNKLRKIIEDRYDKLGAGTKQNPIDFNDIDVSNLDSFCPKDIGIFEETQFKYINISYWDVSNVKSMRRMFAKCEELESVGDISEWNVSNVTDMSSMFYRCELLKSVGDISGWDVSKVINTNSMFNNYKKFNQDISGWDVLNVINMAFMFCNCESFNKDVSKWNVSKVRYKSYAFDNCPIKDEYKPKFK